MTHTRLILEIMIHIFYQEYFIIYLGKPVVRKSVQGCRILSSFGTPWAVNLDITVTDWLIFLTRHESYSLYDNLWRYDRRRTLIKPYIF